MTAAVGLPISNLVNVSVNLTPKPAVFPNLSTCLVIGTSTVINITTRMREYTSIAQVAADFGTTVPEYLAAVLWFEQTPQPQSLLIGRWAQTASKGQLIGGLVPAVDQLISTWQAISTGSMRVSIDNSVETLSGLDFTLASNLNGVCSVINLQLTGAVISWDSVNGNFIITSNSTGVGSTVSFVSPTGSGTDVSAMLAMTAATGAFTADGVAAESAVDCVTIFDNKFSSQWYGLVMIGTSDQEVMNVAAFIEASSPAHFYGVTTQEVGVLNANDTSNIAYSLKQLGYTHTAVQYSSTNAYAVTSLLARILTTNWSANLSTITLMYKQEPGIIAESLTQTQMNALLGNNANVFVNYNNSTAIIQPGITPSGQYIDTVIGCDWLRGAIQTNVYNLLYGTSTKIPQTDAGMHQIATQVEAACVSGVNNGLLAPGQWNSQGVGQIAQGDYLSKGYYVYTPPLSSQAQPDRAARKAVPIQVLAKLAGAVQQAEVLVAVNS